MKIQALLLAAAGALALSWAAACGDSDENPVPAANPDASTSDGTIVATGDGSTVPMDDSSVTPQIDTGTGDTFVPSGDPDGGTSGDGGPGGNTSAIACGTTTCAVPGQVCCVYDNFIAQTYTFTCVTGATCPEQPDTGDNPPALSCTGPANCASTDVCCIEMDNADNITATCKPAASCDGNDTDVLCDPAQPNVGCAQDEACSSEDIWDWNLPGGFGTCQD